MRLFEIAMPIKEGGNAIKSSTRINQDNVAATLADIERQLLPKLNIKKSDTASLGSTGKKAPGDSSGDVDLAISVQALTQNNNIETPKELYDFVVSVANSMSHEIKDMRGMGLVSLAWPISNIDGLQDDEFVQLDLMTVDSIDWAKWAYYAPGWQESPYKGLYRNEILHAIARFMNYEVVSRAADASGQEVDAEWKRDFFDLGKGLLTGQQSRIGKKGIVKTTKTINKTVKSLDPKEVTTMLFGPNASPESILTWEQAFSAIMADDFIHKKHLDKILKMTKDGILKKGYPVPPELDAVA